MGTFLQEPSFQLSSRLALRGSYEILGHWPSVPVESYILAMWAGHADSQSHVTHLREHYRPLLCHLILWGAILSLAAGHIRTTAFNKCRVGGCVSAGSIDNTSIFLADMYNYSYMVCVALGYKLLHTESS